MTNPYPDFYEPARVGRRYVPEIAQVVVEGQTAGLRAAHEDQRRTILLLVDAQVDFVHTDGALSVPGAVDDTRRTIEWLFAHTPAITAIAASLDSHIPTQIFFPPWWANADGDHPAPYTPISADDVEQGRWRPLFEPEWSRSYVRRLEENARKTLMIWPYHTLIGTPGHTLTPALYEAVAYHAAARQSQPAFLTKGTIAKTEYYSLLEPEVKVPDHPEGDLKTDFLHYLASYDRVYVAGQAKSHCVLETVGSVMRYFAGQPDQISKWHVLTDCMSPVAHPQIDFGTLADETFARFAEQGLKLVTTQDPLD